MKRVESDVEGDPEGPSSFEAPDFEQCLQNKIGGGESKEEEEEEMLFYAYRFGCEHRC